MKTLQQFISESSSKSQELKLTMHRGQKAIKFKNKLLILIYKVDGDWGWSFYNSSGTLLWNRAGSEEQAVEKAKEEALKYVSGKM